MIGYLHGKLIFRHGDAVVIDASGVGYEVTLPYYMKRAFDERAIGDEVAVFTYYAVSERQPRPMLYGFETDEERRFFEKLLEVKGIGPSKAAKAMVFSVSTIARAIESGDLAVLSKLEGISRRLAESMVATLRGKVAMEAHLPDRHYAEAPETDKLMQQEALAALQALGFKAAEAREKIGAALQRSPHIGNTEELVQEVFRGEQPPTGVEVVR